MKQSTFSTKKVKLWSLALKNTLQNQAQNPKLIIPKIPHNLNWKLKVLGFRTYLKVYWSEPPLEAVE